MRFIGGPYDRRDLPIQPPYAKLMRLPREQDLNVFLQASENDPGLTEVQGWPYLYELDDSVDPAVYRFKAE